MSGGSGVDHIQGQYPGPLSGERQLAEAGLFHCDHPFLRGS